MKYGKQQEALELRDEESYKKVIYCKVQTPQFSEEALKMED